MQRARRTGHRGGTRDRLPALNGRPDSNEARGRRVSHESIDPFKWAMQMQPGDQVQVCQSVVVFHHPQHRGEAFDLQGHQGEVVSVLNEWKGRVISPTLPVIVAFGKFRAHFRADELEEA